MQKRESCLHDRTLLCENPFGGYATPTKCVAFWRLALNILEVGSEQLRKWNINKKMTNSTKYIDC